MKKLKIPIPYVVVSKIWPRGKNSVFLSSFSLETGIGEEEIQRQNRITAQIVANYLERRLFPFKRPTHRLPTVDEILPTTPQPVNQFSTAESKTKIPRDLNVDTNINDDIDDEDYNNEQDIDPNDPENLQSVESNHVDSYYPEMNDSINIANEGRFQICLLFCFFQSNCFFVVVVLKTSSRNVNESHKKKMH